MLGTGNALVTKCYNTCFVIENENDYLMVDAGGGNTVLNQLEKAGINWKDVKHIFVTHKHIDHLLGMIWMIRLICQNMAAGKYEGEAYIYGHQEVIEMLETISQMLLQSKQTKFIHDRLHLVVVNDGQTKEIIGKKVTFFDIHSTKAKQFGFMMELDQERKLTCCGDEPYNEENEKYEHGFITADLIKKYAPKEDYSIFLCGPSGMYHFLDQEIQKLFIERKWVRHELQGELHNPELLEDYPKDISINENVQITVHICDEEKTITASTKDTILQSLEKNGIAAPARCRSGECGWCHSLLLSGKVYCPKVLEHRREADLLYNYIHPCCTFPLTDIIIDIPPVK